MGQARSRADRAGDLRASHAGRSGPAVEQRGVADLDIDVVPRRLRRLPPLGGSVGMGRHFVAGRPHGCRGCGDVGARSGTRADRGAGRLSGRRPVGSHRVNASSRNDHAAVLRRDREACRRSALRRGSLRSAQRAASDIACLLSRKPGNGTQALSHVAADESGPAGFAPRRCGPHHRHAGRRRFGILELRAVRRRVPRAVRRHTLRDAAQQPTLRNRRSSPAPNGPSVGPLCETCYKV